MTQKEMFGTALWVCAGNYTVFSEEPDPNGTPHFPVLRSHFDLGTAPVQKATLRVVGLGWFHCYLNGRNLPGDDLFLPFSTDYQPRNRPAGETVTGHRMYVPEYDVTDLLKSGENLLALHFGGGWYCYKDEFYGFPKAIFRLTVETADGVREICSSEKDKIGGSYITTYHLTRFENRDYNLADESIFDPDFCDTDWQNALPAPEPDTEYLFTDCPTDGICNTLTPTLMSEKDGIKHYDMGLNTTGWPVLRVNAAKGEKITVTLGEECGDGYTVHPDFVYGQRFTVISDGKPRLVHPEFTWFGFRFFSVEGNAEPECCQVVHARIPVTAYFTCSDETLNWLYNAYINTQLNNIHAGIPSDCPHIERRGYTGDGQLTCHACMDMLDARAFYAKWIADIGDCQDVKSGHVQYTAPYTHCGGGPGGWGCAIVEVPFRYYKHYGDIRPADRLFNQMLRYLDYLDEHSENGLVTSDQPGQWCLGDWCTPEPVMLPAAFVNNYFYVKSAYQMIEIAALTGRKDRIPALQARAELRKSAMVAAYYNTWDSNFLAGRQGANAFALDIGLGNEQTYKNTVEYYEKIGYLDTGIFGTDVLTRVLFAHGDGDLAVKLLTSEHTFSFHEMMRRGSSTIWEYMPDATCDRSHDHPMFGACIAQLFDRILGIRETTPGGFTVDIEPFFAEKLSYASGYRTLPMGEVWVSWRRTDEGIVVKAEIPNGMNALLKLPGMEPVEMSGKSKLTLRI